MRELFWALKDAEYGSFISEGRSELVAISASIALVLIAGLMSGLTLGLMSLDMVEMEVLKRSGTPLEKRWATRIQPLLQNPHWLLVTLLVCNAAAMEALPIFLEELFPQYMAIILSVTVVLIFGEVLPQAICSKYGLAIGAYTAWFVNGLMVLCAPISWPVGKLLDAMLGHEQTALFRRAQLKAMVEVYGEAEIGGYLTPDEIHIIRGAMDLESKTVETAMTPLDKVFMLSSDAVMDEDTLGAVLASGHSRIPVHLSHDRNSIVGLILVKEMLLLQSRPQPPKVADLKLRSLPRMSAGTPMYDMLKLFQTGRSHMAVLTQDAAPGLQSTAGSSTFSHELLSEAEGSSAGEGRTEARQHLLQRSAQDKGVPIGIITIEDIIEELLQGEIVDETDLFIDNEQKMRVNANVLAAALPERLRRAFSSGFLPRIGLLAAATSRDGHAALGGAAVSAPLHGGDAGDGACAARHRSPFAAAAGREHSPARSSRRRASTSRTPSPHRSSSASLNPPAPPESALGSLLSGPSRPSARRSADVQESRRPLLQGAQSDC